MIRIRLIFTAAIAITGCAGGGSTSGSGSGSVGGVGGVGGGAMASSASSSTAGAGGATGACTACEGVCVDTQNDPHHCGSCGKACGVAKPLCDHGSCAEAPCDVVGPICPLDHLCCGDACCAPGKMCCNTPGGSTPKCVDVDAGACPTTCLSCQ